MNTLTRVGAFGAGLVVAFGAAFGVGRAADLGMPGAGDGGDRTSASGSVAGGSHGHDGEAATPTETRPAGADHGTDDHAMTPAPAGLTATDRGYRLVPARTTLAPTSSARLDFRVLGPDGRAVTRFTTAHEKKLHLIVVRRDLSGYQHLHPTMATDGTWSVQVDLSAPGQWRMLADFDPDGPTGGLVLGADLAVPGHYRPVVVPAPDPVTTVGPFTLRTVGALSPATAQPVGFTIARTAGGAVSLEPYLGAGGHLVVLREGDLAFAHAHPTTGTSALPGGAAGLGFQVEAPGPGRYRLFLDFKVDGAVRTGAFTVDAGGTP